MLLWYAFYLNIAWIWPRLKVDHNIVYVGAGSRLGTGFYAQQMTENWISGYYGGHLIGPNYEGQLNLNQT